jgi:hypothetical protein
VRWAVVEGKKLLEPGFDKYRDGIASVEDKDGRVEGLLVTYAEHVQELVGFRSFRPRWRPTEVFKGWFMPSEGRADEVIGLALEDLEQGRWGDSRLRWLSGPERDAAWAQYLSQWGPHESSHLRER